MNSELDVAAAGVHAHATDDGDADVTQLLVFAVGQGEAGGHGDGVTGVHADRVDVLDRADDHDVVVAVAHELELEFLPTLDALFDQDFVGGRVMDAGAAMRCSSSSLWAMPEPRPPMVKLGRTTSG